MARPKGKKKTFEDQVKEAHPEFYDAVQSLSSPEINARLAKLAQDSEEIQEAQESDHDLEQKRKDASEAFAPYRDGKKMVKMKSKYLVGLLKERGGA